MTILENMREVHLQIKDGDVGLGNTLQSLSCVAIEKGMGSQEWSDYMEHFSNNDPAKLAILTGQDANFNAQTWGKRTLVYAVAGGCCGITTTSKVTRDMMPEMRSLLKI